jgi:propionyl-CoA carboxylase alpha chain
MASSRRTRLRQALRRREGIVFIGPNPANAIAAMGDKIESKKLAKEAGVNVRPRPYGPDRRPERGGEDRQTRSAIR